MSIVSLPLTVQLTNGTVADANQVMTDLNQIATNVNTNAAGLTQTNSFTQVNTFAAPISGVNGIVASDVPIIGQVMMLDGRNQMAGPLNMTQGADIASAATVNLTTATGNSPNITGTTGITAFTLGVGMHRVVTFTGTLLITASAAIVTPGSVNILTRAGDAAYIEGVAAGVKIVFYQSASGISVPPRSYLAGYLASTPGTSPNMTVQPGSATSSDQTTLIVLGSAITKNQGAWAVGSATGGLDTGTIASNTTYHFYAIYRPDTGVTDICFSLSATAPTTGGNIPAAYTKFRRIYSNISLNSGNWLNFIQFGDCFRNVLPTLDVGPSAFSGYISVALTLPTGIVVMGFGNYNAGSSGSAIQIKPPSAIDAIFNATLTPLGLGSVTTSTGEFGKWFCLTDTTGRVAISGNTTVATYLTTEGWYDNRGKDL